MVVDLFIDTPDINAYKRHRDVISGGTTNPSLMSKLGIPPEQYESHVKKILDVLGSGILSVEVTNVIPDKMYEEAKQFMKWGEKRIAVKIPLPFYVEKSVVERVNKANKVDVDFENLIDDKGLNIGVELKNHPPMPEDLPEGWRVLEDEKYEPAKENLKKSKELIYVDTTPLIAQLAEEGVPLNVTCGFGYEQARNVAALISKASGRNKEFSANHNYFSIFWGRLLDAYVGDPELNIKDSYNSKDLEKMIKLSTEEVKECARQLEGTGIRIIIGSARLPKIWETNAKKMDKEYQEEHGCKTVEPYYVRFQREAYRSMLKIAQPVAAIPTVFPGILEAARYHPATSIALKGFADDYLKFKEKKA